LAAAEKSVPGLVNVELLLPEEFKNCAYLL
jgi:hypothetical protein